MFENLGRKKDLVMVDLQSVMVEVSNAYLVGKIGFDTEENGPFEVRYQKMGAQVTDRSRQVTNRIRRNIGSTAMSRMSRIHPEQLRQLQRNLVFDRHTRGIQRCFL